MEVKRLLISAATFVEPFVELLQGEQDFDGRLVAGTLPYSFSYFLCCFQCAVSGQDLLRLKLHDRFVLCRTSEQFERKHDPV